MELKEKVICPYDGVIKKIYINKKDFVVEKDVLFEIELTQNRELKWICSGIRGTVSSLAIGKGEEVLSGMVLASIKQVI
jgi:biotin carboxyl carrier protein